MRAFTVTATGVENGIRVLNSNGDFNYVHVGNRNGREVKVPLGKKDFSRGGCRISRATPIRTADKKTLLLVADKLQKDLDDERALVLVNVGPGYRGQMDESCFLGLGEKIEECPLRGLHLEAKTCCLCDTRLPSAFSPRVTIDSPKNVHPNVGIARNIELFPDFPQIWLLEEGYAVDRRTEFQTFHHVRLMAIEPNVGFRVQRKGKFWNEAPDENVFVKWTGSEMLFTTERSEVSKWGK